MNEEVLSYVKFDFSSLTHAIAWVLRKWIGKLCNRMERPMLLALEEGFASDGDW
jgi:hypothetical protein